MAQLTKLVDDLSATPNKTTSSVRRRSFRILRSRFFKISPIRRGGPASSRRLVIALAACVGAFAVASASAIAKYPYGDHQPVVPALSNSFNSLPRSVPPLFSPPLTKWPMAYWLPPKSMG